MSNVPIQANDRSYDALAIGKMSSETSALAPALTVTMSVDRHKPKNVHTSICDLFLNPLRTSYADDWS